MLATNAAVTTVSDDEIEIKKNQDFKDKKQYQTNKQTRISKKKKTKHTHTTSIENLYNSSTTLQYNPSN
jgi:hypothetical protein